MSKDRFHSYGEKKAFLHSSVSIFPSPLSRLGTVSLTEQDQFPQYFSWFSLKPNGNVLKESDENHCKLLSLVTELCLKRHENATLYLGITFYIMKTLLLCTINRWHHSTFFIKFLRNIFIRIHCNKIELNQCLFKFIFSHLCKKFSSIE